MDHTNKFLFLLNFTREFFFVSIFVIVALSLLSNSSYVNYWQAYAASGSIVLDNVQATSATVISSPFQITLANFAIGSGTNRVLIVGIESSTGTVSSVTYGGVALTPVVSKSNIVDTEFWILKNPASGSADIDVDMSTGSTVIVGAYSFFGVDQTNPVPTTATNSDIVGDPSVMITNSNAYSWVLDSVVIASTSLSNPTQNSQWNIQVIGTDDGASSSATVTQPNTSTTFGWTAGAVGVHWTQVAIEVKASEITQTLSETVGITDTVSNSPSKSLSDSILIDDVLSKQAGFSSSLSDSVSVSDQLAAAKTHAISLSEPITLSDSVSVRSTFSKSLTEGVGISDTFSHVEISSKSLSESISISDSVSIPGKSITSGVGGSNANITPPTFGGSAFSATEYPFSLGGTDYQLPSYTNTIPTTTFQTGKPVEASLLLYSNSGPAAIQHIALYTNLHGLNSEITQSDTYIIYEKGEPIQIVDPNNFFSHVSVSVSQIDNKLQVVFDVTFAKPMDTSHVVLRVWDSYRNSVDTKILNAWQVVQSVPVTSPPSSVPAPVPTVQNQIQDLMPVIKEWGGYSSTSISNSELLADMGIKGHFIPPWFMKTAKWVVNNETTQQDFLNAIKYMYDKEMIK